MYACLAVTCHLHFWQNDRDFLRATVVTRGWNGYRNKSQHRESTLVKKILPPFQQGFEPATFQSRVRRSNHWAIPAPPRALIFLLAIYCMQWHNTERKERQRGYDYFSALRSRGRNTCYWCFTGQITNLLSGSAALNLKLVWLCLVCVKEYCGLLNKQKDEKLTLQVFVHELR